MMKLGTRMRYGTRALLELALAADQSALSVAEIAQRQEIPAQYLELVFARLRSAGLVQSVRGAQGGYLLARPAKEIGLRELYELFEGPEAYVPCTNDQEVCARSSFCVTQEVWARMYAAAMQVLADTSLADLAARAQAKRRACVPSYEI